MSGPTAERLEPFDHQGVSLLPGRWKDQVERAGDYYLGLSEDDILHGFRMHAGLAAPGSSLGGWCAVDCSGVFGQWLSGLARLSRATGDERFAAKAHRLLAGLGETLPQTWRHYSFDKLVGGLVDLCLYAGDELAFSTLTDLLQWGERHLDHENVPAARGLESGRPHEWYTLAENLYRAHSVTGEPRHRELAGRWHYDAYWDRFAAGPEAEDVWAVHAYSHLNTFSSAAMAYASLGDEHFLDVARHAYDFFQRSQCFATGGFGPAERIVPPDGSLGRSLDYRMDSFEAPCGSWAGFKLSRYLLSFTGEARYGDWIERLLYNGIGAALPISAGGRHFYYADYRTSGGLKVPFRDSGYIDTFRSSGSEPAWTPYACCSGTYLQAVADYHDLIWFRGDSTLCVNLYLPSTVRWRRPSGEVTVTQRTRYPEVGEVDLSVEPPTPDAFSLAFRVPSWAGGFTVSVNGEPVPGEHRPGTWATVSRTWSPGDTVRLTVPLPYRWVPVDEQHPHRAALMRGPVVLVQDAGLCRQPVEIPDHDEEIEARFEGDANAPATRTPHRGTTQPPKFRPFYTIPELWAYRMYFDLDHLPTTLW